MSGEEASLCQNNPESAEDYRLAYLVFQKNTRLSPNNCMPSFPPIMANRPVNCYTNVGEIDNEIRRVEQELCETKALHDNLYRVHTLAGEVIQRLQNNNQPQINQACNGNGPAVNPRPSTANCQNAGGRICACGPNQCTNICVSPGTPGYQQLVNGHPGQGPSTPSRSNMSSGVSSSTPPSGSTNPSSMSSGSTVAEIRVAHNPSESSRSTDYYQHTGSATLVSSNSASRHSNCSHSSARPNSSNYSAPQSSQQSQGQQFQQYHHPQQQQQYYHQQQPGHQNTYTVSSS